MLIHLQLWAIPFPFEMIFLKNDTVFENGYAPRTMSNAERNQMINYDNAWIEYGIQASGIIETIENFTFLGSALCDGIRLHAITTCTSLFLPYLLIKTADRNLHFIITFYAFDSTKDSWFVGMGELSFRPVI